VVAVIAIYARQSIDKKDSISIESQIDMCKKECGTEATKIYSDKGFSGKNTNRPKFEQLMKDVKDGYITKVVVYRLDRFSRSIADFGQAWAKFQERNVEFISINEKFDTSAPMGRAMLHIIMVFAQLERETIAERVKDNYYSRIKHGNWPGGPAPLGFNNAKSNNDDGKKVPTLIPNKDIEIVKRIFFEYSSDGVSLGMIAKELSEEGIDCMKRKTWDNVAISRILHNPVYVEATADVYKYYRGKGMTFSNPVDFYTGETSAHIVGKRSASDKKYTKLENHVVSLTNFSGIIPSDIWLKCQYKLDNNKQIKNTGKGTLSWLSGYIKCGKCGYSLAIRKYKDQLYLHCSGRTNLHLCDVKSYTINISEIEAAVQVELENVIHECTLDKNQCIPTPSENKQKIELEKIDQKIEKLIASLTEASDISMKYINGEIENLDKKRNDLLKNLGSLKTEAPNKFKDVIFDKLSFDEKKLVVNQFIEKIMVFEDEIEIIWKV
jgi:DNA invertase Pin-like site-specific DNA recombinase